MRAKRVKLSITSGYIQFRNLMIIAFLVAILLVLFLLKDSGINLNPKAYPYRFYIRYAGAVNPAQIFSAHAASSTTQQIISFQDNDGICRYTVTNLLNGIQRTGELGNSLFTEPLGFSDIDNDSRDELVYLKRTMNDVVSDDLAVQVIALDDWEETIVIDTVMLKDNLGNSIRYSEQTRESLIRLLIRSDEVTSLTGRDYFALVITPESVNGSNSSLRLYRRGIQPARKAEIRLPVSVLTGIDCRLPDRTDAILIAGMQNTSDNQVGRGSIILTGIKGDIKWKRDIGIVNRRITAWANDNPESPIISCYCNELSQQEENLQTSILKINRADGEVVMTTEFNGRWIPFVGVAAGESGYLGMVMLSSGVVRVVRQDGSFDSPITVQMDPEQEQCPVIRLPDGGYGLITSYDENNVLLSSFQGDLLAVMDGFDPGKPLRLGADDDFQELLPVSGGRAYFLLEAGLNSPLWWIVRWRGLFILLLLPPVVTGLGTLLIKADRRKKSHLSLLKAYDEMETHVQERTKDLADVNKKLELEVKQRQQAELELRSSHDNLAAIFNGVSDCIVSLNENGRIINANAAFYRTFDLDENNITSESLDDLLTEGYDQIQLLAGKARAEGVTVQANQLQIRTRTGEVRMVRATAVRLGDGGSSPADILLVMRDVTQLYTLKREKMDAYRFKNIIGQSEKMLHVFHLMEEISRTDTSVLLTGESGTGKELVAKALHYNGLRSDGPLLAVNCAALSENILESELFGHVKGAFTGAVKDRAGLFETARGGTLFLDEIGDVSLAMQAKLLRVLQEDEFSRVGETKVRKSDARIIAATNQDLAKLIEQGKFRNDLYYRLNVFSIHLPPLRERTQDIPLLVDHFIGEFNTVLDRHVETVSDEAMEHIIAYPWHGNLRELRNIINGAMILCHGDTLEPRHFHPGFFQKGASMPDVPKSSVSEKVPISKTDSETGSKESELLKALEQNHWNVTKTARQLGVSRTYVYKKLKALNVQPPR